jgi:integral membrane sensor domain MASE1
VTLSAGCLSNDSLSVARALSAGEATMNPMPITTSLRTLFDSFADRPPIGSGPLQAHTPLSSHFDGSAAADREPLLDLSLAGHLLLPLAIFATSLVTIELSRLSNLIATLWPTNAILLVALLRHVRSLSNYASILIGGSVATAIASLLAGNSLPLCVILAAANLVEIATAFVLLAAFQIGTSNLTSFKNLLIFIIVAGGIAPIGGGIVSAVALGAAHGIPATAVWRNWYPGHALGMIIVAPFLISVTSSEWQARRIKERFGEAGGIFAFLFVVGVYAIFFRPIIFILAPLILFATIRFGLIGATLTTFATAVLSTVFVVLNLGESLIQQADLSARIFALQVFLAITSLWSIPTAALLAERDRLRGSPAPSCKTRKDWPNGKSPAASLSSRRKVRPKTG